MKTRESKKKLYCSNYIEKYRKELSGTIFAEDQEMWIELSATNKWEKRKKDIENKADALMYGNLDGKTEADKIKEELKMALR